MVNNQLETLIFNESVPFLERALAVFEYQYSSVSIYKEFCDQLQRTPKNVRSLQQIPFLPIEFFKYHKLLTTDRGFEKLFRSSGTTGQVKSNHFVADLSIYEQAIINGFRHQYGDVSKYCILGLLPSYLERKDASLVHMIDFLMQASDHKHNGFYLDNLSTLQNTLRRLIDQQQPTILIGVTFALLDLAEQYPMNLDDVIVMETGGMKGRREEMTRSQLHKQLKQAFKVPLIHSEYGMTELLSQAYFTESGHFQPSPTMRILIREINDPFAYQEEGKSGALNIVDLANLYSCSFIATQDIGKAYKNNHFDVLGRIDASDLRGCNLMVVED